MSGGRDSAGAADLLAVAQGGFYLATGLWPIIHLPSFEAVTGEKTDKWLVKTVGALIAAAGATMTMAGLRRRVTPEIALLAAGSAAALATVDVNYTAKGVIPPVYLLDAAAEAALIAAWAVLAASSPGLDEEDGEEDENAHDGRSRRGVTGRPAPRG